MNSCSLTPDMKGGGYTKMSGQGSTNAEISIIKWDYILYHGLKLLCQQSDVTGYWLSDVVARYP